MGNSTSLGLSRCTKNGICLSGGKLTLPGAAQQLVLVNLDDAGTPRWHGAIGPVEVSTMVSDKADRARVVFTTSETMQVQNVEADSCPEITQGAAVGTYVAAFAPAGSNKRAACTWALRLGP